MSLYSTGDDWHGKGTGHLGYDRPRRSENSDAKSLLDGVQQLSLYTQTVDGV
jgi:hypothetical protein